MCVDRFHIVSLFLSNPCTPSTLSKEAFVYFVCPTEIPQPPFAWKYYLSLSLVRALSPYLSRRFQSAHAVHVFFTLAFDRSLPASLPPFLQTITLSLSSVLFALERVCARIHIDTYINTHKVSYNESGSCFTNFGSPFKVEVGPVKLGWGGFSVKVTKRPRFTSLYFHRPDLGLIPPHAGDIQKYGKHIHFIKFSPWLLESGRSRLFFLNFWQTMMQFISDDMYLDTKKDKEWSINQKTCRSMVGDFVSTCPNYHVNWVSVWK